MTSSTFPYISLYALHYQLQTPYLPTPTRVARCMLQLAEAKPGELVVDLGCGEGNVLIAAAKYFKCRCVGIEIDPRLAKRAKKRAEEEGVEDLVEIIMGDLFLYDLSSADIVTLYLLPKTIRLLQYKLAEELKDTAKVVSHDYPLENTPPAKVAKIKSYSPIHTHKVFLYYAKDLKRFQRSSPT